MDNHMVGGVTMEVHEKQLYTSGTNCCPSDLCGYIIQLSFVHPLWFQVRAVHIQRESGMEPVCAGLNETPWKTIF